MQIFLSAERSTHGCLNDVYDASPPPMAKNKKHSKMTSKSKKGSTPEITSTASFSAAKAPSPAAKRMVLKPASTSKATPAAFESPEPISAPVPSTPDSVNTGPGVMCRILWVAAWLVFLVGYLDAAVVLTLVYHRLSSVAVPVQAVTATSLSVVDQNKTLAVRYLGDNFDFLSNVAPIKAAAILVAWPVTVALCAGSGDLWSLASCVAATVGTTLFTVGVLGESYAASRL